MHSKSICALSFVLVTLVAHAPARADTQAASAPAPAAPTAAASAPAASGASRTYTLAEVLRRAATGSPDIAVALATLKRVQAELALARGAILPTLSGQGNGGAIYDNRLVIPGQPRIDSTGFDARGTLTFNWTLLDMARRGAVRAATSESAAEREASQRAKQRALSAAAELYLTALTAEQRVNDAGLTLARRVSQHEAIAGLVRAGVRPPVDEQRAQIEVLNARTVARTRALERTASNAALAAAMGDDPLSPVAPAALASAELGAPADLTEAVRLAEQHRPETRELFERLRAKDAELAAAIGARMPTVGVSGNGNVTYFHVLAGEGIEGMQYDANGALYVRWAGLDATVWRRARHARAAREEADKKLAQARFQLRREVVAAHYALATAATRLEQAVAILSVAEVTRESQNERYRAGVSSLLELLDAEDVEQRARQGRIEAELAYLTAQASLLTSCGLIERLATP